MTTQKYRVQRTVLERENFHGQKYEITRFYIVNEKGRRVSEWYRDEEQARTACNGRNAEARKRQAKKGAGNGTIQRTGN